MHRLATSWIIYARSPATGSPGVGVGGVARINGVIPVEVDGWVPAECVLELSGESLPRSRRVRVLVGLTALELQGLDVVAADYSIEGLDLAIPTAL